MDYGPNMRTNHGVSILFHSYQCQSVTLESTILPARIVSNTSGWVDGLSTIHAGK